MDPEPIPDVLEPLMRQLDDALSLEHKFRPLLELPRVPRERQDVTIGIRDGSAHVLRCLKIWYDLPSDVFFIATSLMDRFLSKMKVKAKHMACVSISSFQTACRMVCGGEAPELQDILAISQAKCTVADLVRMQEVVSAKLGTEPSSQPITPYTFLALYHALLTAVDRENVYSRIVNEYEMWQLLEVVLCDASCSNFRPSEIALALLCSVVDTGVVRLKTSPPPAPAVISLISFIAQIQQKAKILEIEFLPCHSAVLSVIGRYNAELQIQHRQRLVWKVSQRTLKQLRPTGRLVTTLQTIDEHGQLQIKPHSRNSSSSSNSDENWTGPACSRQQPTDTF
ncbi:cyclin G isoform X1 [Halyomorpha halys]|uniref:cyclin G isoform X1 n=1 Tax=Halyomorpha halys TaxID=286706 RepID=UPI0006D4DED7|nr:cyclin G isoform X1 [Halyomorpha halys]XP_014292445.1 cyclin G isoform X1 [Halyomorpha halys]